MSGYDVKLGRVTSGFDGRTFWAQARAGCVPGQDGEAPTVVVTAQPALRSGSDLFYALSEWRSSDFGATWDGPVEHGETLGRREEPGGTVVGICDMTPAWHASSGRLLSTGQTVRYSDDEHPIIARRRETAYSVYDVAGRTWSRWATVEMPNRDEFRSAGAGSSQRVDLDDGTILLPISFKRISDDWHARHTSTVMRCSFDGEGLAYLEHGTELTVEEPRGLCEPSVARCGGRYVLTLRNDERGYVTSGTDGLHYDPPAPWRFDDGTDLGNYNTQQHLVARGDELYLVYTRRGLDNDHVFRHRAPLMIGRVDTEKLCVVRESERVLVPERGARIGNFSVCDVGDAQTWIVVAEWMQPVGCEQHGSDNTVWAAQISWKV